LWEADLVEMIPFSNANDGFKYILTVIDVLSKKAYARALKTKTQEEVMKAFADILTDSQQAPRLLNTDRGLEFYGGKIQNFFKSHGIVHYSTLNFDTKATVVERFNKTLKGLMYRYFTYRNTNRYVDVLDKLLLNYNKTWHSSIKMTPFRATRNAIEAFENLYPDVKSAKAPTRLRVGDYVRLLFKPDKFRRGFQVQWTEEIFKIIKVERPSLYRAFPLFRVEDLNGEAIQGTFYALELQKVARQTLFIVDQVLVTRKRRGKTEYFVSWRGYGPEFNSWVSSLEQQHG
jgi:hypothetical protein